MGCWSPLNAMKAYVHALQLSKDNYNNKSFSSSSKHIEPECIEYISALAAGHQAQLMLNITLSDGVSPSALALAIAARYTGGRLVCICQDKKSLQETRSQIQGFELGDVVSFKTGDNPWEIIKQYKNVDFAVVDHRIKGCEEVLLDIDMNRNGSVVVLSNLFHGRRGGGRIYGNNIKRKNNGGVITSKILPIGNGIEVIKIGKASRFLVLDE